MGRIFKKEHSVQLHYEDPLDFSLIPANLQCEIINKLKFHEFLRFEECSRLTYSVCWKQTHWFSFLLKTIYVNEETLETTIYNENDDAQTEPTIPYLTVCRSPVKILADTLMISDRISSDRLQKVAELFDKNRTTASEIKLLEHVTFKAEDLDFLLKVTSPKYFTCPQFLSRQFFQTKGLQSMKCLTLANTGCTDQELVKLNGEGFLEMRSDFITERGVNEFMKQWKNKEREIYFVCVQFGSSLGAQDNEAILEGLDANPVWTPATHYDSVLGALPLESVPSVRSGDPEHIYSVWRHEDTDQKLMIKLSGSLFRAHIFEKETFTIIGRLSDDEHYIAVNECRDCSQQFCEHRRRYSVAQLKKHYPTVHSALVHGFKGLGVAIRLLNLLNM